MLFRSYDFQGIYNLWNENIRLFEGEQKTTISQSNLIENIDDPSLETAIGSSAKETLAEELELVREVYPKFDREAYLNGEQHPVFFGSTLNNFGVQELLDCFVDIAPPPLAKDSEERNIAPDEKDFSGFVFKIHANMDPKHRDRLAFIKIVIGDGLGLGKGVGLGVGCRVGYSRPWDGTGEVTEVTLK